MLNCTCSFSGLTVIGYNYSIDQVEAATLLDTKSVYMKTCYFKDEGDLWDFCRRNEIDQYMVVRSEEYVKEEEALCITWHCPYPLGNPFLLSYMLYSNGSGCYCIVVLICRLH